MKRHEPVKHWTTKDIVTLGIMRSEGRTIAEIAEKLGRTEPAIRTRIRDLRREGRAINIGMKDETPLCDEPALTKKKTLDDFTPREMIKHLYNLGYRIIGGKVYLVQQTLVNLNDIIFN